MKLHDIKLVDDTQNYTSSEILEIIGEKIKIGCATGAIIIGQLQPKSKAKMSAKAYILGKRLKIGDNLF